MHNCNTPQQTTTHCNALQHTATRPAFFLNASSMYVTLQAPCRAPHIYTSAAHSNNPQHTSTHRNTLQHTATHHNTLYLFLILLKFIGFMRRRKFLVERLLDITITLAFVPFAKKRGGKGKKRNQHTKTYHISTYLNK